MNEKKTQKAPKYEGKWLTYDDTLIPKITDNRRHHRSLKEKLQHDAENFHKSWKLSRVVATISSFLVKYSTRKLSREFAYHGAIVLLYVERIFVDLVSLITSSLVYYTQTLFHLDLVNLSMESVILITPASTVV